MSFLEVKTGGLFPVTAGPHLAAALEQGACLPFSIASKLALLPELPQLENICQQHRLPDPIIQLP